MRTVPALRRMRPLPGHGRTLVLGAILVTVAVAVGGFAFAFLYETAFEQQRAHLTDLARSQARLMEAVARYDRVHSPDYQGGPGMATLSQIVDAHGRYDGMGETGEFTLARRAGDKMILVLRHPRTGLHDSMELGLDSGLGEPMRMALLGQSGTMVGRDYRGEMVLAAYEPVDVLDLGLVAKIDLAEVRAPFIMAGMLVAGGSALLVCAGIILFFHITSPMVRRLLENEEIGRRDRLIRAQVASLERSNAELRQFAYVTSHDLNEPLNTIEPYVGLLVRRYRDRLDPEAAEFLDHIGTGVRQMKALIRDILAYSHIGTKEQAFAPTSMEEALDQALSALGDEIEDRRGTITRDRLPVLEVDYSQIIALFRGLIDNALKFSNTGRPAVIHVGGRETDGEWTFSIADNGIGIKPEFFDRIFLMFQRLHPQHDYPGTGVGLAICKRIVERHGGRIWVESTPGEGSTFSFTLPKEHSNEAA